MNEKEKYVLEHYEITKEGEVYSTLNSNNSFKRRKLTKREDKDGYYNVSLVYNNNRGRQPFRLNRLVLLKFKGEDKERPIANHIDLNKKNNHLDNLEWVTVAENTQHGYDNERYSHIKRVKSIDVLGNVRVFPSISHASRFFGYANPSVIQQILQGHKPNPIKRGLRKGLFFEFTEEDLT